MPVFITITHPELGQAQIIASALPVWQARGWRTALQDVQTQEPVSDEPSDETALRESEAEDIG